MRISEAQGWYKNGGRDDASHSVRFEVFWASVRGDCKRKGLNTGMVRHVHGTLDDAGFHQYCHQLLSKNLHCVTMLRAAFLSCAYILPAFFASTLAGQLVFGPENIAADNPQVPLGHHDNYRLVCHGISRSILSASQVFYPGTVFALISELLPSPVLTLRRSSIRGRHHSLDELKLTDICVFCAARHCRGPQLDRSW